MVSAILARRAVPILSRQTRHVRFAHIENTHETVSDLGKSMIGLKGEEETD